VYRMRGRGGVGLLRVTEGGPLRADLLVSAAVSYSGQFSPAEREEL
jgi:hypothetical protein